MQRKIAAMNRYLAGGFDVVDITSDNGKIEVQLENDAGWRVTLFLDRSDAEALLYDAAS